ncbi:hypothetical protein BGW36DRAFT_384036 [Talaromyces proteolyticus]|uniref:BTB domain transcription factor n=1 Tax=Talaromyces proteolyticus TaxID=1131652 RepID=A0AAD4PXV1_9EURO|nr:uncharacterized protein BGW36DRAFT_384036 [Talaromyces proteolyticus]KAH8693955.1 hypothetical protein BGW36DRAFT_384036 [Talaromyces proteolyticus]
MPVRTSSRQAAVKANQAFTHGLAGSKRKSSADKGPLPKKGKKEEKVKEGTVYEKPSVTEELPEKNPSEAWSDEQVTVNKQPTEAPPQKAEEQLTDGVGKEEEKPKEAAIVQEDEQVPGEQKEEEQHPSVPKEAGAAVKEHQERESIVPSTVLEKGIIYFLFRPRVNVEDPQNMSEVARSFFVLRPTPKGAKIEDGPIGEADNCRLMMLPKKKYPTSGRERDMGFVEKAKVSLKTIREKLMASETYQTQTQGERTTPEARPYAEGVYAIVKEGRNSHLVYILTIPEYIGDVQNDFGLFNSGSFVFQVKNPKFPGPPSAQLPKTPEYPEEIMSKFRDLRWVPVEPEFLDYPNAQFLMIGSAQNNLGRAGEIQAASDKEGKETPAEELSKFESENEERVESLAGDHTIFNDLGIDAKKHANLPKTWE